jgi:Tfp pilus assembly protein PilF
MVKRFLVLAAASVLVGCASPFWQGFGAKGDSMLASGLRQYEEGNYAESARMLQVALDEGLRDKDRVTAYKHLAFINCAEGRERVCREHFIRALTLDPRMELAPAEAGHPVWGPVYRAVKSGR